MSMLDDDLAMIHADALALGMADTVIYITAAGVSIPDVTGTFAELPEPFLHEDAAEVRRRTCTFECRRSIIAAPAKGDTITAAAGAYAGTWSVVDLGSSDDGGHVLTVRLDNRISMGTGRRLPTEGAK
jgi:hypothetical protein